MKSNCNHWSFKHEFYPSTFPAMMIEAECGACGRVSFFVAEGFDQSANYCSYCGAKMDEEEVDRDNAADISADCDEEESRAKFADYCAEEEKSWKKCATVHVYKSHRQKQS